jgi:hypothetical protein
MIFFGWGNKTKTWNAPENSEYTALVCNYTYFNLSFIFQIALKRKWVLISSTRNQDKEISYAEVKKLYPLKTPQLNLWERFGLFMLIIPLILLGIAGTIVNG